MMQLYLRLIMKRESRNPVLKPIDFNIEIQYLVYTLFV